MIINHCMLNDTDNVKKSDFTGQKGVDGDFVGGVEGTGRGAAGPAGRNGQGEGRKNLGVRGSEGQGV